MKWFALLIGSCFLAICYLFFDLIMASSVLDMVCNLDGGGDGVDYDLRLLIGCNYFYHIRNLSELIDYLDHLKRSGV